MNTPDSPIHEIPPTPPNTGRQPGGRTARWGGASAFAVGGGLTALALFAAAQFGAFDAVANTRPAPMAAPPDQRLDRVLSLLESGRDCDLACLAELRGKVEKSGALEQTLGHLQESTASARQRAEILESQKQDLAERLAQVEAELQTSRTRQGALEGEKSDLTKQLTALRAGKQGRPERRQGTREGMGAVPIGQASIQSQPASPLPGDAPPKLDWTVIGMTPTTVVVSTANHRVVALAAGETLDGVTVRSIDSERGVANTTAGILAYKN